jgi:hypothetical protein
VLLLTLALRREPAFVGQPACEVRVDAKDSGANCGTFYFILFY